MSNSLQNQQIKYPQPSATEIQQGFQRANNAQQALQALPRAESPADHRRRTRELAMQMAIQANVSGTDASDLVRAAKIIGDFLEGDAA